MDSTESAGKCSMSTRDILVDYVYPRTAALGRYGLIVEEDNLSTASGNSFYYDALEYLDRNYSSFAFFAEIDRNFKKFSVLLFDVSVKKFGLLFEVGGCKVLAFWSCSKKLFVTN